MQILRDRVNGQSRVLLLTKEIQEWTFVNTEDNPRPDLYKGPNAEPEDSGEFPPVTVLRN